MIADLARRACRLASLLLLFPAAATAQGYAGLGEGQEGFAEVQPGRDFSFPEDHGAHDAFRIEWWYVTANLTGADGADYGLQWTLFRSALTPEGPNVWFAHAAVTSASTHLAAARYARGDTGQAGVVAEPFDAWIDEWRMAGETLDDVILTAAGEDFAYDVALKATGPLVLQGEAGYSVKSPAGQASHYYSQPFYEVTGTLTLPDGEVEVTGEAWLDREFSSQYLGVGQEGWDWWGLSFDDGSRLMGFVLRGEEDFTPATWIAPDGTPEPFPDGALQATPLDWAEVAGREVPVRWRLELPAKGVDIEVTPLNEQAWMDVVPPYWEGPVTVTGSHEGRGYLEMTGYE
ncbi:lipocalin-like domain-containing protein [Pseudoroseicyclus tamaricis]|uniref:Iron ABC transporter permease n=1 Tax=Pseudoroseicyclus tamaricis TaxID=2705421 RepID=A0A6B2JVY4_9RHOB|nr:lipocalin-like domain-containing protein [Pseudoroseicyclus tamaricis]NDU99551.1 iron ABC transporter permease [Pseudoroseicyclus tamaricis]